MRAITQKPRKNQRGFTLVEVLISMVLLAVGVLALSAAQVVFFKNTTLSQCVFQANGLADQVFEIVLRNPTLVTGGGSTSFSVASDCAGTGDGLQAQMCRALNNAEKNHMTDTEVTLQQIDAANSVWQVSVEWQSAGGTHLVAKDMGL